MTQELFVTLIVCLMAPIHAVISATAVAGVAGFKWGLSNRVSEPELPHWAIRLKRAHANLIENIPSFIGIVLIAHVLNVNNEITVISAWAFCVARILFSIVYVTGLTFLYIRTVLYFSSLGALAAIAWQVLSTNLLV
jgi:uncharacterized MAPEG superfamily protein